MERSCAGRFCVERVLCRTGPVRVPYGARRGGASEGRWWPRRVGGRVGAQQEGSGPGMWAPKFRAFSHLTLQISLSRVFFSWDCGSRFKATDHRKCALGIIRGHLVRATALNRGHNTTRRPTRKRRKNEICGPHLRALLAPTLQAPHPSGPHPVVVPVFSWFSFFCYKS